MNTSTTVTILTSTYNRKELLSKLYESLQLQKDKDFEWLIIDDGSTDGTSEVIDQFISNADFSIRYELKENGGKHTALNYAYQFIESPLTFIVDSDDKLTDDAVVAIKKVYHKYQDEKDICGFSFLRGKPDGAYLSDSGVPKNGMKESYVECRINRGIGGDMAEVWYTHCLKEYPFPEFKGEKFLGEDVVWIQMGLKYQYVFINKPIYRCEYLEGGLTANDKPMKFASPRGSMMRGKMLMKMECGIKQNLKGAIIYDCYKKMINNHLKKNDLQLTLRERALCFCCEPLSYYFYWKWKS